MHLHRLNRVDRIVGNYHCAAFLVRECAVTMTDVQFLQPVQNVILQPRNKVLRTIAVSTKLCQKGDVTYTSTAGSPSFSWSIVNKETGLFRLVAIQ